MNGILGHVVALRIDILTFLPAVEDALQLLAHLHGTGIALPRIISAGLQHNFRQTALCMRGRGKGRAGEAPGQSVFPVGVGDGRWRGRQERRPVPVQKTVKDDSQRIDVHRGPVSLSFVDLRSHVGVCTLL